MVILSCISIPIRNFLLGYLFFNSLKDTFILEMSTKDEDNDSIIVEDGLKYKFNEIR